MVSQLPVSSWHEVIGEPTIADAICDRIVHSAHRIDLEGDSIRKLYAERANRGPRYVTVRTGIGFDERTTIYCLKSKGYRGGRRG